MKHKKKRKGVVNYAPRCPYCGSTTVYRSATGIYKSNPNDVMLYVCTNYPNCDAYVQTQKGTAIPLGEMANGELRALRNQAHRYFNKLYLQKYIFSYISAVACQRMNDSAAYESLFSVRM